MSEVSPGELLLEYFIFKREVNNNDLFFDMAKICRSIKEDGLKVPIDFRFFGNNPDSDVINDEMWILQTEGSISEERGSLIYRITPRGETLLQKYRERRTRIENSNWERIQSVIQSVNS